jgi:hypothetical protein
MWLECAACHWQTKIAPIFTGCPACRSNGRPSPLEVRYDYSSCGARMPLPYTGEPVTLGGGNTPLLPLLNWPGAASLYVKNETLNPTWSWKDRPNRVSVTMAKHFNYPLVGTISTGNHGNSLAAHAAAADRRSYSVSSSSVVTAIPAPSCVREPATPIPMAWKASKQSLGRSSSNSEALCPIVSLFRWAAATAFTEFGRGSKNYATWDTPHGHPAWSPARPSAPTPPGARIATLATS